MSNQTVDWAKLVAQGRAKAWGVAWTDEEAAARAAGVPADFVRAGILTKEDYTKALDEAADKAEADIKEAEEKKKKEAEKAEAKAKKEADKAEAEAKKEADKKAKEEEKEAAEKAAADKK